MPTHKEAETRAKAASFDRLMTAMEADRFTAKRRAALERVARTGTPEATQARRILDEDAAAGKAKAKGDATAALPRSINEAKGDVRAFAKADMLRQAARSAGDGSTGDTDKSRASMRAELAKQGLTPVGG